MAGKRVASTRLNQDNWNDEEESEEPGVFQKAAEEALKNRVIRVAKRRNPIGSLAASSDGKPNIFGRFSGFNKPATTTTTSSPFGFLANVTPKPDETPKANGINSEPAAVTFKMPENKTVPIAETRPKTPEKPKQSNEYYAKLKGLNQSVCAWIKKHVDGNPLLNLTPVFKDYERYFTEIETKYGKEDQEEKTLTPTVTKTTDVKTTTTVKETKEFSSLIFNAPSKADKDPLPQFIFKPSSTSQSSIFGNVATTNESDQKNANETFQFGFKPTIASTPATFNTGKSSSSGFTFGNPNPSNSFFGSTPKPTTEAKPDEDCEDEPPKVEFTPVVEEGHVFSTRCKVFVKKDGQFSDRGVGQLYLKPVQDSEKLQLIVRADTSLGNLLCNFILSKNIPTQRMGKKDVMLVCLPTPDSKPPPTPVLLRVKTPEEADELLKTLEKHKK